MEIIFGIALFFGLIWAFAASPSFRKGVLGFIGLCSVIGLLIWGYSIYDEYDAAHPVPVKGIISDP